MNVMIDDDDECDDASVELNLVKKRRENQIVGISKQAAAALD